MRIDNVWATRNRDMRDGTSPLAGYPDADVFVFNENGVGCIWGHPMIIPFH